MELEVGKKYRLNNGEEHVCKFFEGNFSLGGFFYESNGVFVGQDADCPRSVAYEVKDNQYKPLCDFAPFKAGERFRDEFGDVLKVLDCCKRYDWIELGGKVPTYKSPGMSALESVSRLSCPLDRDEDTPKLWGDMTPAEKGALLLAHHEGKVIEWNIPVSDHTGEIVGWKWVECENVGYSPKFAYRVRPEPSFLPLEAGKIYQTAEHGDWECIHVDGKNAWLKGHGSNSAAYVWDANTGFAKSLGGEWDITGLKEG